MKEYNQAIQIMKIGIEKAKQELAKLENTGQPTDKLKAQLFPYIEFVSKYPSPDLYLKECEKHMSSEDRSYVISARKQQELDALIQRLK